MAKLKCLRLILLISITVFLLSACRGVAQKPGETRESSIFRVAPVEYARIIVDRAEIKAGLGNDFNTIGTLNRDDIIRVLSQIGDWYVVQMDNNQVGALDPTQAKPIVREDTPPVVPPGGQGPSQEPSVPQRPDDPTPIVPQAPGQQGPQQQPPQPGPQQLPEQINQPQGPDNLTSLERRMIDLVNNERQKNGLQSLIVDPELTRIARIKSQDMVDNNYFSHNSPTYGSPFEMLSSFGVKYLHAGENLAGNRSVDAAHNALMNSAGHRQNILNPNFTHIGVGVRPSNRYGNIFTQLFISKPK